MFEKSWGQESEATGHTQEAEMDAGVGLTYSFLFSLGH